MLCTAGSAGADILGAAPRYSLQEMPGRKAEIVRELARRGDAGDSEGIRELLHPDAAMWGPTGWPEPGPFRGRDAVGRQFDRLGEDYVHRSTEIDEVMDLDDWLVARMRWHVRARHSGIESDLEVWFATRFEDEMPIEIRFFWSREETVEAATEGSAPGTR